VKHHTSYWERVFYGLGGGVGWSATLVGRAFPGTKPTL